MEHEGTCYGQVVKTPLRICGHNLQKPMFPLIIHFCYYCQKSSSERDVFQTNSGKIFLNVQLCHKCVEYNIASQEAGDRVLNHYNNPE